MGDISTAAGDLVGHDAAMTKSGGKDRSLAWWVRAGTMATTLVGTILFLIFASLLSGVYPWEIGFTLRHLDGNDWFDAARTTVTLVGIIGLGGAAFLAYRKQRSTEEGHELEVRARDLEDSVSEQAKISELRNRYVICAEQLGSKAQPVRLAGVYALAGLADDWCALGNAAEQQVCVNLLCAYLRTKNSSTLDSSGKILPEEMEVRDAIVDLIRSRLSIGKKEDPPSPSWVGNKIDLSRAVLCNANFKSTYLKGAIFSGAILSFADFDGSNLEEVDMYGAVMTFARFRGANLQNASMQLSDATSAKFNQAFMRGASLGNSNLTAAVFSGRETYAIDVPWSNRGLDAHVSYVNSWSSKECELGADLATADLRSSNLTDVDLRGANLQFAIMRGAYWTDLNYDSATKWPDGQVAKRHNPEVISYNENPDPDDILGGENPD